MVESERVALVAQWIEHLPPKKGVARSIRAEGAIRAPSTDKRYPGKQARAHSDIIIGFVGMPTLTQILQCLKKHGQRLDSEIAKETGMPLAAVRTGAAGLASTGALIACSLVRFENGKRIEGWVYRMSGYVPPAAPGRKAKTAAAPPRDRKPVQR